MTRIIYNDSDFINSRPLCLRTCRKIKLNGTIIGYSKLFKDFFYTCYSLNKHYYIGLKEFCTMWEVKKELVNAYTFREK
jgi:hypothetical protein